MVQWFKSAKYNFVGNKNKAFVFSGVLIVLTIVSLVAPIYPGRGIGPRLSIDFTGGTVVQLKFQNPVEGDLATLRTIAAGLGYGKPEVKSIGRAADHELQIVIQGPKDRTVLADEIKAALTAQYGDNPFEVRRIEAVGPKVGSELGRAALLAILLSFLVIVIYVAFRFSLPFGVAAVIALIHDVLITVGVFSIANIEISLPVIAALLTIAGYSINDTIVIFDRIRENLSGSLSKQSFEDRLNSAINQTLSRTIVTTMTTLFTVVAMGVLFMGTGDVVFDFSLALFVGMVIGTYSSVFIAAPVVVLWNRRWAIAR